MRRVLLLCCAKGEMKAESQSTAGSRPRCGTFLNHVSNLSGLMSKCVLSHNAHNPYWWCCCNGTGSPLTLGAEAVLLNFKKNEEVRSIGKMKNLPEIKWRLPKHLEVKEVSTDFLSPGTQPLLLPALPFLLPL